MTSDSSVTALAEATSAVVADALDALGLREQVLHPAIRPLWSGARLVGRAMPVVVVRSDEMPDEPYRGEMAALEEMSPGDVGVYEVEGGSIAAAWGELFSCAAIGRGARGVVVDGPIRDARQIEALGFPTFARGFSPLDTRGRAIAVEHGSRCVCGGVDVARGDLVVADVDGVVIVPEGAVAEVAERVRQKRRLEDSGRADLLAGLSIQEVWDRYRVF